MDFQLIEVWVSDIMYYDREYHLIQQLKPDIKKLRHFKGILS